MNGLYLLFMGQTAPIWLPGPGLALWPSLTDVCSSSMCWYIPILLHMLQHCVWDPWGAFVHILKEQKVCHHRFKAVASSKFAVKGQIWHFGPIQKMFAHSVCVGASQFFYANCNIVFGTHQEPLYIY